MAACDPSPPPTRVPVQESNAAAYKGDEELDEDLINHNVCSLHRRCSGAHCAARNPHNAVTPDTGADVAVPNAPLCALV